MEGCGILKKIVNIIKDVHNGVTHDELTFEHKCASSHHTFSFHALIG